MSTPATIGLLEEDGTVTSIQVNGDGYPSWTGQLLLDVYADAEIAKRLIDLGDCSYIDKKLERQNPDIEEDGVTVAYHRDRDEDWEDVQPIVRENEKEFWDSVESWEYGYLLKGGKWWYAKGKSSPVELTHEICMKD